MLCALSALSAPTAVAAGSSPLARAYEMVSPHNKNGADIGLAQPVRAAADGHAVAYTSFGGFADGVSRIYLNQYRSERSPQGWSTANISPPADPFPQPAFLGLPEAVSSDASAAVASSWGSDAYGHPQMINLWRYRAGSGGGFDLLSQPSIPFSPDPIPAGLGNHFAGASDDFGHIVFTSTRRLTADSPDAEPLPFNGTPYLYEWFAGLLRYVGISIPADAGVPIPDAVLGYDSPARAFNHAGDHAISADGAHIFFSSPANLDDPQRKLYLRADDLDDSDPPTTVRVDVSERSVPDPQEGPSLFQLASADGRIAFFASSEQLTEDATAAPLGGPGASSDRCGFARCDLYRWDADAPAGQRLMDVTTGDPSGAAVVAAVGASDDGSRVYFVAYGELAPGATQGVPNLYLWRQGDGVRHVATLDGSPPPGLGFPADSSIWSFSVQPSSATDPLYRDVRVTADGRFIVFRSRASLTPYPTAGTYQLYRYDAQTDELSCLSCNLRTTSASADSYLRRVASIPAIGYRPTCRATSRTMAPCSSTPARRSCPKTPTAA